MPSFGRLIRMNEWLIFAIAAAFLNAVVNVLDKLTMEKLVKNPLLPTSLGIIAIIPIVGIVLLNGLQPLPIPQLILAIFTGGLYVVIVWLYFTAMKSEDATRVVPLAELTPIAVLVLSIIFIGETFSLNDMIGVVLLSFGGVLISFHDFKKFVFRKGLYPVLGIIVVASISFIITDYVLNFADFWSYFAYQKIGVVLAVLPFFITHFKELRRTISKTPLFLPVALTSEVLTMAAVLLIIAAQSTGSAALVTGAFATQPFFLLAMIVILGIHFPHILKEENTPWMWALKLVAILSISIGVYLIA